MENVWESAFIFILAIPLGRVARHSPMSRNTLVFSNVIVLLAPYQDEPKQSWTLSNSTWPLMYLWAAFLCL